MQGRSWAPLMAGETPDEWRTSIYCHYYESDGRTSNVYKRYGVRTGRYKPVYFYTLGEWEFYDLQSDPNEMQSEYANPAYAEQVQELKTELARLRKQYKAPVAKDEKPML